ncbi:MAG: carboxymuconolactone decarboxylase family protein [Alphaproteobacteria bacterium]|nr:carboxymuconolactone decarboxylase family protein [Alphaproteobacteria bacterium]
MSRLPLDYPPTEKTEHLFEGIKKSSGSVINIFKLMGHSPAVLESYLGFSGTLSKGSLAPSEREHIALAVAGFNGCEYCAAAHAFLAKKEAVDEEEAMQNLKGSSATPKIAALIQFCLAVLKQRGKVTDQDFEAILAAGYKQEQVVEIVANIALNVFTIYFNNSIQTPLDFPKVEV